MDKFPILTLVGSVLRLIGWIIVVAGVAWVFTGFGIYFFGIAGRLLIGLLIAVVGLTVVGAGESIGVLFAIEANTRKAAERT